MESENPEAYLSSTAVAMDGSCNGLQHYAALALDDPGGAAVNLTPSERPQVLLPRHLYCLLVLMIELNGSSSCFRNVVIAHFPELRS